MPLTEVQAFLDTDGTVEIQVWLDDLETSEPKAYAKCLSRILELAEKGYDMRRPHADMLRDGVYELRATFSGTHYRILYFYNGKNVAVLSHGCTKEDVVPPAEINKAVARKKLVERNPAKYLADFEV